MQRETFQKSTASQELYWGLIRTMEKLRREVEDLLKTHGLSEAQYNVLCILKEVHPQSLSCGEISARLVTRDPDITRLLDRLEQPNLVKRRREAPDRRITYTNILPEGLALLEILEQPMAELHERQFTYLAGKETDALFRHLTQIKPYPMAGSPETSPNGMSRQQLVHTA